MNARLLPPIIAAAFLFATPLHAADAGFNAAGYDETETSQAIDDYMSDGWSEERELDFPLLGMTLREEIGKIGGGAPIVGLGVTEVTAGSPAERAGISAPHTAIRTAAVGILLAGGLLFPPAMFGALAMADSDIGNAHDLIVAVDGYRTQNMFQFRSAIRRARPGQTVYLRVVRSGERHGLRVEIPPGAGLGLTAN